MPTRCLIRYENQPREELFPSYVGIGGAYIKILSPTRADIHNCEDEKQKERMKNMLRTLTKNEVLEMTESNGN